MKRFFELLLFAAVASWHAGAQTNQAPQSHEAAPAAVTAAVPAPPAPASNAATNTAEQVEAGYQALLSLDNTTMNEIRALYEKRRSQEGSERPEHSDDEVRKMVKFKIESVKKAYQTFLAENPTHVKAMIAYGSFLSDIDEEEEGVRWWLKARELDPKNPAVRNDLANHYSHDGSPKKAIEEYEAAIQLQPSEPVYQFNLGNTYYLFRKDVAELKHWSEDEIFDHALECFKRARDLEPNNYDYAYAYAETFYGVKHPNWQRALEAWQYCLKLDLTPLQRDQIYAHLARVNIRLGKIAEARNCLAQIKSDQWQDMRQRLTDIANHQEAVLRVNETLHADTGRAE